MTGPKHFLDLDRMDPADLRAILEDARARKAARPSGGKGLADADAPLAGRVLALIFDKPSTRTRISFDVAMRQLGGSTLFLTGDELQLGRGETIADTAQVLSRYVDAAMIRTLSAEDVDELAENAAIPIINGLTRRSHPCQLMADVMTFEEHRGPISGRRVAWCGDGNNVAISWIHAAVQFGFELNLACPEGHRPPADVLDWARAREGAVRVLADPAEAVSGADCVVTDTWVSMGDEDAEARHRRLAPFQVDAALMARAAGDAIFMHCLPAHRGEEVTAEVIDGPQSVVFDEAENRLHAQKSILAWCLS